MSSMQAQLSALNLDLGYSRIVKTKPIPMSKSHTGTHAQAFYDWLNPLFVHRDTDLTEVFDKCEQELGVSPPKLCAGNHENFYATHYYLFSDNSVVSNNYKNEFALPK